MTQFQSKRLRNRHLLSSNRRQPAEEAIAGFPRSAAMRGFLRESQGTRRNTMQPMKLCAQIAGVALLTLVGLVPAWAVPGSVSGLVRNSAGVPQIGAQVQLLRTDLSVMTSVR